MGSRSGVLWDALAGRRRSSRTAAVASLKDKKITAAMLTFDENVAFLLTDKSGKLLYGEIADALAEHSKEGISKEGIASVVAAFDTDGDDELDRQEFEGGLHELLNQKAAGSQADLLEALAALNSEVQAVPAKQLSVGKLRALAGQLGQLKADAESMADLMEAKGAAKTASKADAKTDENVAEVTMANEEHKHAEKVASLSLKDLRALVKEAGLSSADCIEKAQLRLRAAEAVERLLLPGTKLGPVGKTLGLVATAAAYATEGSNPGLVDKRVPQAGLLYSHV